MLQIYVFWGIVAVLKIKFKRKARRMASLFCGEKSPIYRNCTIGALAVTDEFSVGIWVPVGGGDGEIVGSGRTVGILDFYSDASALHKDLMERFCIGAFALV